jgi:hypothetical protein
MPPVSVPVSVRRRARRLALCAAGVLGAVYVPAAHADVRISAPVSANRYDQVQVTAVGTDQNGQPAAGNMIVQDGGTELFDGYTADGTVTVTTEPLEVGTHVLLAYFDTGAAGGQFNTYKTLYVHAVPTVTITSSANPSLTDQQVTETVQVTGPDGLPVPSGTVDLYLPSGHTQATLDGNGETSVTLTPQTGFVMEAYYEGDFYFWGEDQQLQQIVATTPTVLDLSGPRRTNVKPGKPLTLTANLWVPAPAGGLPTGSIGFYDGATLLASVPVPPLGGPVRFTTRDLALGRHVLTAQYTGEGNLYYPSTSSGVTVTVLAASPI